MYDELWVAGKCMYKLEPVVADGGELIIYAPHLSEVSETHGAAIRRVGYHTRDYFLGQWDRFKHEPWGTLAHSTHVRGGGTYENGVENPRVRVTLASQIPREECEGVEPRLPRPGLDRRGELRGPGGRGRAAGAEGGGDAVPLGGRVMPRATICVVVDDPGEVEAGRKWLAANRRRLTRVSENRGCGCCVDLWDVEGPREVLATLPDGLPLRERHGRDDDQQ